MSDGSILYRCVCGALVEYDYDEGDCEDDEVQCPACGHFRSTLELREKEGNRGN